MPTALAVALLLCAASTSALAAEMDTYMRSTQASGGAQVTVLKQGYLLKQSSSNFLKEWKRRFFCLDSLGMLYYYSAKERQGGRDKQPKNTGTTGSPPYLLPPDSLATTAPTLAMCCKAPPSEPCRAPLPPRHAVSLLTSTVKPAAEEPGVRYGFRLVSPERELALQAENEAEQREWMEALQVRLPRVLAHHLHYMSDELSSGCWLHARLGRGSAPVLRRASSRACCRAPSARNNCPASLHGPRTRAPSASTLPASSAGSWTSAARWPPARPSTAGSAERCAAALGSGAPGRRRCSMQPHTPTTSQSAVDILFAPCGCRSR